MLWRSVIMAVVLLPVVAACNGGDAPQWTIGYTSDSRDAQLTAIVAVARDEGWAVGMDGEKTVIVLHRQGRAWKPADLPAELSRDEGADLSAPLLAASGPDNVWLFATLAAENIESGSLPGAIRWDGQRWQKIPGGDFIVRDIAVLAPDNVWALGGATVDTGIVHHWDGKSWTDTRLPMDDPAYRSNLLLAGDGAGGFVLAALHGPRQQYTAGGTVRTIKDPKPVAGRSNKVTDTDRNQLFQPSGLTLVPGTREIWAAGAVGLSQIYGPEAFTRGTIASYTAS